MTAIHDNRDPVRRPDSHNPRAIPKVVPGDRAMHRTAGFRTGLPVGNRAQRPLGGAPAPSEGRPPVDVVGAGVLPGAVRGSASAQAAAAAGDPEASPAVDAQARLRELAEQLAALNRQFTQLAEDLEASGTRRVSPDRVWRALRPHGIGVDDLRRRDRTSRLAWMRILVMWLMVRRLGWTRGEAAVSLARDVTAVRHALRRGDDWWDVDPRFRTTVRTLCQELGCPIATPEEAAA